MPASEERLTALEKTVASLRNDFLQAIIENTRSMSTLNKVVLQQEQNARDANHEITILTGVIASQGQDIKDIKNRMDGFDLRFVSLEDGFVSLEGRFASLEGGFVSLEGRFASLEGGFVSLEGRFASLEGGFVSLESRFASLEGEVVSLESKFASLEGSFASLEGRFASSEGKLEQVLQLLTTPPRTD